MILEVEEWRGLLRREKRGKEYLKYGGDECLKFYVKLCI